MGPAAVRGTGTTPAVLACPANVVDGARPAACRAHEVSVDVLDREPRLAEIPAGLRLRVLSHAAPLRGAAARSPSANRERLGARARRGGRPATRRTFRRCRTGRGS